MTEDELEKLPIEEAMKLPPGPDLDWWIGRVILGKKVRPMAGGGWEMQKEGEWTLKPTSLPEYSTKDRDRVYEVLRDQRVQGTVTSWTAEVRTRIGDNDRTGDGTGESQELAIYRAILRSIFGKSKPGEDLGWRRVR